MTSTVLLFWATTSIDTDNSLLAKQLYFPLAAIFGSAFVLAAIKSEHLVASRRWLVGAGLWAAERRTPPTFSILSFWPASARSRARCH